MNIHSKQNHEESRITDIPRTRNARPSSHRRPSTDAPRRNPTMSDRDRRRPSRLAGSRDDPSKAFSPFSSEARRLAGHRDEVLRRRLSGAGGGERGGDAFFGLGRCRTVSAVLRVALHPRSFGGDDAYEEEDRPDEDGYGPVLFPLPDCSNRDGVDGGGVANGAGSESGRREVVLVNPHAFEKGDRAAPSPSPSPGDVAERKRIVGKVTVETARLVAEVSQISSEDWARKYSYDEILWPSPSRSARQAPPVDAMSALARAAASDLSRGKNRVVCLVGGRRCGKTEAAFGSAVSRCVSDASRGSSGLAEEAEEGLLPRILRLLPSPSKCRLSVVEVADDDVLRDVLGFSARPLDERGGHPLRLRRGGGGGAAVEGLTTVSLDASAREGALDPFRNETLRRMWKEGGHGHFVATISGEGGGTVQLVDCASPDRASEEGADAFARQRSERRTNAIRKSLSSLRGVLRGLAIERDSAAGSPAPSFRECLLTQLLQRCLQPEGEKPRVVVIGAVCPSARSYGQTLSTMDWTTRLSARVGDTATDPFGDRGSFRERGGGGYDRASFKNSALASVLPETPTGDRSFEFEENRSFRSFAHRSAASRSSSAGDGTLLKSIVSDPRQRLAKLLSTASFAKSSNIDANNDNNCVDTPRESSVASEDLNAEFRNKYDSVFDQLDTLMSADEDDVDKRSYGNSLIEALSEKKPKKGPLYDDLSAAELFSPEVASWGNGGLVSRREPLVLANNLSHQYRQSPRRQIEQNARNEVSSKSTPNIPSVVVCDDASCRDTVISEKEIEYGNTDGDARFFDPQYNEIEYALGYNAAHQPAETAMSRDESSHVAFSSSSDEYSDNQMVKDLQTQLEQVMMDNQSSCYSTSTAEEEKKSPDNGDIFVKSSLKLLPLNMLLSEDSMDSEPLLSCRSHATMIYGLLHASQNSPRCLHLPGEESLKEECDENCAYFQSKDDAKSIQSDPLDLNDMMATFEKEIDALMGSNENDGSVDEQSSDAEKPSNDDGVVNQNEDVEDESQLQSNSVVTSDVITVGIQPRICSNNSEADLNEVQTLHFGTQTDLSNEVLTSQFGTQTDIIGDEVAALQEKVETLNTIQSRALHSAAQTDLLGDEVTSLKERVKALTETKAASETFIQRIESIVYEENVVPLDAESANPSRLADLENVIQDTKSLVANLQSELSASSTKYDETEAVLRETETKLEVACNQKRDAELKVKDLEDTGVKLSLEIGAFTRFVGDIESLIEIESSANTSADSRQRVCIEGIAALQRQLRSASQDNQQLQTEIDRLHAVVVQTETECAAAKTSADTAQSKNKALTQDVTMLRNKVTELQEDLQQLASKHNDMCSEKEKVCDDLYETRQAISSRDAEISKLKSSLHSSEQKLKSFGVKTAEVMKARIAGLKTDCAAKIESLNQTISTQNSRIHELEDSIRSNANNPGLAREVSTLKAELSQSNAEKSNIQTRKEQIDKSYTLKLRNVSEELRQAKADLTAANEDASKHQAENKSLKVELAHLREIMCIAEESVGELQRLREENDRLRGANDRGQGMLSTSFEIRRRRGVDSSFIDDDRFVHERIAALMRENEHNNISMRTLVKENAALKGSIGECYSLMSAMRKEMKELKSSAVGRKSSPTEATNNTTIGTSSLKTPHRAEFYFPVTSSTSQTEETSFSERHLVAELTAEKELRYKAEEICAGVLANTQVGYEKRDREIKKLRAKLFELSSKKY